MGHQDSHLELRALFADTAPAAAETSVEPAAGSPAPAPLRLEALEATPLALDHDAVPSWRETARFFRKAA